MVWPSSDNKTSLRQQVTLCHHGRTETTQQIIDMASVDKPARKKFKVMTSGTTIDGRNVTRAHLHEMAAAYDPSVYGARVNIEHYLSPFPDSVFSAMGDVAALSVEDINEGPLAGEAHLFAEIEPTKRMKDLIADGKKVYSSIEMHPNFR